MIKIGKKATTKKGSSSKKKIVTNINIILIASRSFCWTISSQTSYGCELHFHI